MRPPVVRVRAGVCLSARDAAMCPDRVTHQPVLAHAFAPLRFVQPARNPRVGRAARTFPRGLHFCGGLMKRIRVWCAFLCCTFVLFATAAGAQERSYKDGPVTVVTSVKVVDGQFENYM